MKKLEHKALLLVEGDTEEVFYTKFSETFLQGVPKKIVNLRGNFSVNKKIVEAARRYENSNRGTFDVYICLDQDRENQPVYNRKLISEEMDKIPAWTSSVDVIATLMMESLFFIDVNGIYHFLRTEHPKRKPNKYKNFRKLTHKDLSKLFEQSNKIYAKGIRCHTLIDALDLNLLKNSAIELQTLVNTATSRHMLLNK